MDKRTVPNTIGLGEPGSLSAPPGTRDWAIAVRGEMVLELSGTRSSQQYLRHLRDSMITHKGYKQLAGADGRPFPTFRAFCQERQPWGLGYDADDLDAVIAEEHPTVEERAEQAKPISAHGEVGNGRSRGSDTTFTHGDRDASYLTARIARDRPDILEQMKSGAYKSVRAAAIDAGIVKKRIAMPTDPAGAARTIRRHFTANEIDRLIQLLTDDQPVT